MKHATAALLTAALITSIAGSAARAQEPRDTAGARPDEAPRVFVDCVRMFCDTDYFRTEIPYVNYVRDRAVADVHILVTRQTTGAGGSALTLNFIGRNAFAGKSDTLTVITRQTDTEDEQRRAMTRTLKLGLVRYLSGTPLADRLDVRYTAPPQQQQRAGSVAPEDDPWNYWVFRTRVNGNFRGEKQSSSISGATFISANRTTEAWKINVSINGRYSEDRFEIPEVVDFTNYTHSAGANVLAVKSVGPRWSAGGRLSLNASTFLNQDLSVRLAPAIEFNVFPYDQSTRRQFTFQYSAGSAYFNYTDTTIFDRTEQVLYDETLVISYDVKQPWGSINSSIEGSHYFHDPSKLRAEIFTSADVRLFKGFSFNLFGSASLIRDQLHLSKENLTPEQVLTRQRQLATSYRYFGGLGLSYTFGSIYQNVVNTRMDRSGGVFFFGF